MAALGHGNSVTNGTGIVTAAPPVLSTKHHVRNQGHFYETMLCVLCPRILGTVVHLPIAQVILLCQHLIVTGPRVGDSKMGRAGASKYD